MYLRHSQTMDQVVTGILFIEFPDLQFHIDLMIDSVYIIGTCRFHLYFFFRKDFVVPLSHPLFNPVAPFLAIPLHIVHPVPPLAPPAATPPASPPRVVRFLSLLMMMILQSHTLAYPPVPMTAMPQQILALRTGSYPRNPYRGVVCPTDVVYDVALFWHFHDLGP